MNDDATPQSTGRLFGEALQHWLEHQGRFWMLAGPAAVIVAAIPYAKLFNNWLPLDPKLFWIENAFWVDGGAATFVEALILYQWFKYALYEDWPRRRALLLRLDRFPWGAFLDLGFIAFWAIYLSFTYAFNLTWGAFVSSQMPSAMDLYTGTPAPWIAYVPGEAVVAVRGILLGLLLGGFMLFLPARAGKLSLGPLAAFRDASGVRGRLIALLLLWSIMTLVGGMVAERLAYYLQVKIYPAGLPNIFAFWFFRVFGGLLGTTIEFVAYYILAHAVTRLFVVKTGWQPEPLPVPVLLS